MAKFALAPVVVEAALEVVHEPLAVASGLGVVPAE